MVCEMNYVVFLSIRFFLRYHCAALVYSIVVTVCGICLHMKFGQGFLWLPWDTFRYFAWSDHWQKLEPNGAQWPLVYWNSRSNPHPSLVLFPEVTMCATGVLFSP